jgi:hypothetical protein
MSNKIEKDDPGDAMLTNTGAVLDLNPFEVVDDPEARAELQEDPDLRELAELTALAAKVRALLAPERSEVIKESDRLQQIEQSVLYQQGILPIAIAEMDAEAKRHILDTSATGSLSLGGLLDSDSEAAPKSAAANKRSTKAQGRKDGP